MEQYTNETYGYQIDYPIDWTIHDDNPGKVSILEPSGSGQLRVSVAEATRRYTLDEGVELALQNTKERMDNVTVLGQRDLTLPNNQQAHVIDMTFDNPSDSAGEFRAKYLATVQGLTVYEVSFGILRSEYSKGMDAIATNIIESFALTE